MFVGQFSGLPSPRGPHKKSLLDQKGFIDLFQGLGTLRDRRGQGAYAHGSPLELVDQGGQYFVVHFIEAMGVHIEGLQPELGDPKVDRSIALDLGKVPDPSQKGIADSGGTPTAARNL